MSRVEDLIKGLGDAFATPAELRTTFEEVREFLVGVPREQLRATLTGTRLGRAIRAFGKRGDITENDVEDTKKLIKDTTARALSTEVASSSSARLDGDRGRQLSVGGAFASQAQEASGTDPHCDVDLEEIESLALEDVERGPSHAEDACSVASMSVSADAAESEISYEGMRQLGNGLYKCSTRGIRLPTVAKGIMFNAVEQLRLAGKVRAASARRKRWKDEVKEIPTTYLIQELEQRLPCPPPGATARRYIRSRFVARLLHVPYHTVRNAWRRGRKRRAKKKSCNAGTEKFVTEELTAVQKEDRAKAAVIRIVLSNASKGRPQHDMAHDLNQLRMNMASLGSSEFLPERLLHHRFPVAIEHCGALIIRTALANILEMQLPSLGIRSDICIFVDSGTIGHQWKSCRDNLEFLGISCSTPEHPVHESSALFIEAVPSGLDGRSEAQCDLIMRSLGKAPWRVSASVLKSCLAIAGADGQYAQGEKSKHEPNHCLDLLFEKIGRRPRVGWDGFHRINHAGVASMRSSEEATEFFAVLHELQAQFGYGQGRSAARAVADVMGIRMCRHRHGGGTRKFIYLSKAVDSFLNNFPVFVQTIRLRKHHAETQHRTSHSNAWWASLARRVSELTMLFF